MEIFSLENADTMGERMGRIGQIKTDFFWLFCLKSVHEVKKKSVSIRQIRPIRFPIVSLPSKAPLVNWLKY